MASKDERFELYDEFEAHNRLNKLGLSIREWAREKGFEEDVDRIKKCIKESFVNEDDRQHLTDAMDTIFSLAQIGLMASELGEMAEAIRKPKSDDHLPDVPGHRAENADVMIRLLHFDARQRDIEAQRDEEHKTIDEVIADKMKYNEGRPRKHGKKA